MKDLEDWFFGEDEIVNQLRFGEQRREELEVPAGCSSAGR
jgi:hypothetical protein